MKNQDLKKSLKSKSPQELNKLLFRNREKLRELRFDLAAGKLKNVKETGKTKKEIARILTIINSKHKT